MPTRRTKSGPECSFTKGSVVLILLDDKRRDGASHWRFKMGHRTQTRIESSAPMYNDDIRTILAEHGRLLVDPAKLSDEADLYEAGLTSLSTVNVMLAL